MTWKAGASRAGARRLGIFALAVAAACTTRPIEEHAAADSTLLAREASLPTRERDELLSPALRGRNGDALARELGPPDSTARQAIPNRHSPDVTDTIVTHYYRDAVATFHVPGGGAAMLSTLVVADNRLLRFPAIGMTVRDIETAFGDANERRDSSLTYHCIGCGEMEEPVELVLARGRVSRVRFNYYVD